MTPMVLWSPSWKGPAWSYYGCWNSNCSMAWAPSAGSEHWASVGDTSMASEEIPDNFSKVLDTGVVQLNGMHAHVTLQGQEDLMLFTRWALLSCIKILRWTVGLACLERRKCSPIFSTGISPFSRWPSLMERCKSNVPKCQDTLQRKPNTGATFHRVLLSPLAHCYQNWEGMKLDGLQIRIWI